MIANIPYQITHVDQKTYKTKCSRLELPAGATDKQLKEFAKSELPGSYIEKIEMLFKLYCPSCKDWYLTAGADNNPCLICEAQKTVMA